MANEEQLSILKQGVEVWKQWRRQHLSVEIDLAGANLSEAYLSEIDLLGADLSRANLTRTKLYAAELSFADLSATNLFCADVGEANLHKTNLSGADLCGADLSGANLRGADLTDADLRGTYLGNSSQNRTSLREVNLRGADLRGADLTSADLTDADLTNADLTNADLIGTTLIRTKLRGAKLYDCRIYGLSAWDVNLEGAEQSNLIITPPDQPTITVDNLKVAQFLYLLLNNQEVRDIINTVTQKAVLILGRFSDECKPVLDALRNELHHYDLLPIMFDFPEVPSQTTIETVSTLAHICRFVIADLTDARSVLQELQSIVPICPSLPVQTIIQKDAHAFGMLDFLKNYPWFLPTYQYDSQKQLLLTLNEKVIAPAEKMILAHK